MKVLDFLKDVKSEFFRITWLSNKEALIATAVVVVVVIVFASVFTVFNAVIFKCVNYILEIR